METNKSLTSLLAGLALAVGLGQAAASAQYAQLNLTGFQPGMGRYTDPNLNGWGMVQMPDGPFCVADTATGVLTFYNRSGKPLPTVINVPAASGGGTGSPSGLVYNPTGDFVISKGGKSAPARLIFSTLDGLIGGWNPAVDRENAVIMVDNSGQSASYPGLALGQNSQGQNVLYAANWGAANQFEMFDASFNPLGGFDDPAVKTEFADFAPVPFGVDFDDGQLLVTFAMQLDSTLTFGGAVDVFDGDGHFQRRLAANAPGAGPLENPWAMVRAPAQFGQFGHALLIGNVEGPGHINAFDPETGAFLGQLTDSNGQPIAIAGLWELIFPNDAPGVGKSNPLFFTAGPNAVTFTGNGLFGNILPAP